MQWNLANMSLNSSKFYAYLINLLSFILRFHALLFSVILEKKTMHGLDCTVQRQPSTRRLLYGEFSWLFVSGSRRSILFSWRVAHHQNTTYGAVIVVIPNLLYCLHIRLRNTRQWLCFFFLSKYILTRLIFTHINTFIIYLWILYFIQCLKNCMITFRKTVKFDLWWVGVEDGQYCACGSVLSNSSVSWVRCFK